VQNNRIGKRIGDFAIGLIHTLAELRGFQFHSRKKECPNRSGIRLNRGHVDQSLLTLLSARSADRLYASIKDITILFFPSRFFLQNAIYTQ
jgi:hypothetical protein